MAVVIRRVICLDLPTAGLVIGYLGVFGGIWEMIELLLSIVYFDDNNDSIEKDQLHVLDVKPIVRGVLMLMLAICLVDLLTSILLINGTNKKSHRMLLPWLIMKGILLGILIPVVSLCILAGIYAILSANGSLLLINSILMLIGTVVYGYLFMVIYSLYYFIKDESQKQHYIDSEALYSNSQVKYDKTIQ